MDPIAQKRRRRGRYLFWSLVALLVLVPIGGMLYATFGPNPPIVVSKATTYITTPLADDGLPDYAAAIRQRIKRGVQPDQNGAVPFLEAMWTTDEYARSVDDAKLVCAELGLPCPPAEELRISPYDDDSMRRQALRHYRSRVPKPATVDPPEAETFEYEDQFLGYDMNDAAFWAADEDAALNDMRVDDLIYLALDRPWTADDLPFLAAWLESNQAGFTRLIQACERPLWYLPEAQLLKEHETRGSLIAIGSLMQVRQASRLLQIRMGYSQGTRRYEEAARDAVRLLRLAAHVSNEPFLVDHMVAVAIDGIAIASLQRLANDPSIPASVLATMLSELSRIGHPAALAKLDLTGERYFALHEALKASQQGIEGYDENLDLLGLEDPIAGVSDVANRMSVDWNEVLIAINEQHDAIESAIAKPTRPQRVAALDAVDAATHSRSQRLERRWQEAGRLLTAKARGQLIADAYTAYMIFSYASLVPINDRGRCNHDLTRLQLALVIHRAAHGDYPKSLEAVVPGILPRLPTDVFNAKPYAYHRTDDGFLLYSLGENGIDDGGSHESELYNGRKFEGIAIDEMFTDDPDTLTPEDRAVYDLIDKIPPGADDVSLRVPLPVEPWPWEE